MADHTMNDETTKYIIVEKMWAHEFGHKRVGSRKRKTKEIKDKDSDILTEVGRYE